MTGSDQSPKASTYTEVRLETPPDLSEAVCDYIIDQITPGIVLEEEDGAPGVGIIFYVPADQVLTYRPDFETFLARLFGEHDTAVPELRERSIENVEWETQYRESVRPVLIDDDVVVRAPWHDDLPERRYDIIIEPKMAFGTGTHETTRSCMSIIRREYDSSQRFLDLGCGSGILSVLADKLGATYIKAIDYDTDAVENCRENFLLNGVEAQSDIIHGSIEACDGDQPYDFVCANIIKSTILDMLPRLIELTAPGGKLILSGLLTQDTDDIIAALDESGQTEYTLWPDNEWKTFFITKT